MGEEYYPFFHPLYIPRSKKREMKEIKRDFNKYLKKFEVSEAKRWKR